jgi:hypothetical protein
MPGCCTGCPPAGVEVLAEYRLTKEEQAVQQRDSVVVAVRSGALMATAFHPELTQARQAGRQAGCKRELQLSQLLTNAHGTFAVSLQ